MGRNQVYAHMDSNSQLSPDHDTADWLWPGRCARGLARPNTHAATTQWARGLGHPGQVCEGIASARTAQLLLQTRHARRGAPGEHHRHLALSASGGLKGSRRETHYQDRDGG
jgi:hypothetical protein